VDDFGHSGTDVLHLAVVAPATIAARQSADWGIVQAEQIDTIRREPFDYEYMGSQHLLIATERAERYDGETRVDGLPTSHRREWGRKLTFVPAGHRFSGWQKPRALLRSTFLYINPKSPLLSDELRIDEIEFRPRLFFFDADIWATALKLKARLQHACRSQRAYVEAQGIALVCELMRMSEAGSSLALETPGGLPGWQQKKLAQHIEEHLADEVSLSSLAHLVHLSPYHFSRAFKQSFGMPPHRYLKSRRIERAKMLLAERNKSITEIGLEVGFSETSSFTNAFRKFTGEAPTGYRRGIA
jgi:AraC-like DNA-binding protein